MKKVVFLYTELADYFLKCLSACGNDFHFLVIHWPVNKEAPFQLQAAPNTQLINKALFKKEELLKIIQDFEPLLINCSGWIDKDYIAIIRHFKLKKVKTSISIDNHWNNTFKQKIATLISHFTIKQYFDMAWVPGEIQEKYALKLGFKSEQIYQGFYCADTARFETIFNIRKSLQSAQPVPKVFLFVARYVKHKGIFDLWKAFIELKQSHPNDWELWCIGTGEAWDDKVEHEHIKHFGFKQPHELQPYLMASSVYVLPSHFEPWGVSVHEMALSGFPLLLSTQVGASTLFLETGANGFAFNVDDPTALKSALLKIMELDPAEITQMSFNSHKIGLKLQHKDWKVTLLSMIG